MIGARRSVVAMIAALACVACAGRSSPGRTADTAAPAEEPTPARTTAELEALYRARVDSARARVSDSDARFMRDMIAHHAQALVMARLAADRRAGPSVRRLAERIENAQSDEIALMQQWLRDRGRTVPGVDTSIVALTAGAAAGVGGTDRPHAGHTGHGTDTSGMPGMLSAEQLQALVLASGSEFDRLFLLYMTQHHRGALEMVQQLLRTPNPARDPTVSMLANEINADQTIEIALMLRLLAELPDGATQR
jgi:uncharacterized protein (DUF305 family)